MRRAMPLEPYRTLWRHRALIGRLAGREIAARWRGSILGPLWAVAVPLLLLSVYTFVFATVLKTRWPMPEGVSAPFSLILFSGLVVFQLFAETVNASPSLIRGNPVFVKQVVFPLEILPAVSLVVALFNAGVSALVLAAGYLLLHGIPPASAAWIPLVVLPVPFLTLGLAWLLASIGTFLRDAVQAAAILTTVTMFLSPIFYSLESVPELYRKLLWANPLTPVFVQLRGALFLGHGPDWIALGVCLLVSVAVFHAGFRFFRASQHAFADVV